MASGEIVRVDRGDLEEGWAHGYVAAVGPRFFALELIDNGIRFDGFNCLRYADITRCEAPDPYSAFQKKALAARKLRRRRTFKVDMTSLPAMLRTAGAAFPPVTIFTEDVQDGVCYIGKVSAVSNRQLGLLEITPAGEWKNEPTPFALKDVTRIDFGGAYEEALYLVAGRR